MQTVICKFCNNNFLVTDFDIEFYKKVDVPAPTLCPDCRTQRRMSFRNERTLYRRKCDKSEKEIVSIYSKNKPFPVYSPEEWWKDDFDGTEYGRNFDFNRSFFEQFADLQKEVPRIALFNANNVNCDYCSYVGDSKNCYLCFGVIFAEDCFYGSPYYSKDCVDSFLVRDSELCYDCIDSEKTYNCDFCQECTNSHDLIFCYDCHSCENCIGCSGLRNKKFHIFNEKYSQEEYKKMKSEFSLGKKEDLQKMRDGLEAFKKAVPRKYMVGSQNENVSGNHIFESRNTYSSFDVKKCEDCAYSTQIMDAKDCFDINYSENCELCYEFINTYKNNHALFSNSCVNTSDVTYSEVCYNSSNLFGCISLKKNKYCILNKQYSQEDYEKLVPRIIEHMKNVGLPGEARLSGAKTGEFGQFFPAALSPYGYNETVANEFFPLSKKEALAKGFKWEDNLPETKGLETIDFGEIPEDIKEVPGSICSEVLACESCSKNYRILPQELKFYRNKGLGIPVKCPNCRHRNRLALRAPRKINKRSCNKCGKEIFSVYAVDSACIVYCEGCYLKEIG